MRNKIEIARELAEHICALGGPDIRHLPDEELIELLDETAKNMADTLSKTGVSAAKAGKAFRQFAKPTSFINIDKQ